MKNPEIKLLKKGIKVNGEYFPAHYSASKNNINGQATIYLKNICDRLPENVSEIFHVENDSESNTDYFEADRIRVTPENKFFNQVEKLAQL